MSFIFAMLGLGGGMVYVPLLHWMGFDFKQIALPLGLLLNGLNTMLALIPYSRKKLVDWKGGSFMAVSAMIGSPLGAYTSQFVNTHILKLIFAFVVVFAAIRMLFIAGKEAEKMASLRKKIYRDNSWIISRFPRRNARHWWRIYIRTCAYVAGI